jgi:predicted ATPase
MKKESVPRYKVGDLIEHRYRVMGQIGSGGMGEIYRVEDIGRKYVEVALKMVRLKPRGFKETNLLQNFQREFRLLTQLWHPNLVDVINYGATENGSFYYTMKYVDGPNLGSDLDSIRLDSLVPVLVQICRALMYLHTRGVIHGDLKPSNILLEKGQVKLVDFGLAQEIRRGDPSQTRYITPFYAAPEMTSGAQVDGRVDLYSLGAIAYHWFVGQPPDFMVAAERLIEMSLKDALDQHDEVPGGFGEIIRRLLAEAPDERYLTANQVIEALNETFGSSFVLETKETASSYALRARFVGRDEEKERLRGIWQRARQTHGQMVLIGGESGVGKSRLVEELEILVEVEGGRVVWGQCLEDGGKAYQPWREILRVLLRYVEARAENELSQVGPVLATIIPELWERPYMATQTLPVTLSASAASQRLNDAIYQVIRMASDMRPTMVVIEDAHWADQASQVCLGYLGRMLYFCRLFLCVTYRSTEVSPDHILNILKDQDVTHIKLENLPPKTTSDLVDSMLGAELLSSELIKKVHLTAGGNTFFIQELIRTLAADGKVLQRTVSGWQVDEQALNAAPIPDSIQRVVSRRLVHLTAEARQVINLAAVVGMVFWESAILKAGGLEPSGVHSALMECIVQEIIILRDESNFKGEPEYIFAKPVVQQVSYENVPDSQRIQWHERVAAWLLSCSQKEIEQQYGQIAHHFERAGQIKQAVEYLRLAGEQAKAQFANMEAIDFFSRALNLVSEDQLEERSTLLLACEEVFHLLGRREEQRRDLAMLDLLSTQLDDYRLSAIVALRLSGYSEATADQKLAIEASRRATQYARAAADLDLETSGFIQWGRSLWRQGDYSAAQQKLEKALSLAREIGDRQKEAKTLLNLGSVSNYKGEYGQDRNYQKQALEIIHELGDKWVEAEALNQLGMYLMEAFIYGDAMFNLEHALELNREINFRNGEGCVLGNLGLLHIRMGAFDRGRVYHQQSLGILLEIDNLENLSIVYGNLALLEHHIGDNTLALDHAQRGVELAVETDNRRAQAYTLTSQGHALFGLERQEDAFNAYHQAASLWRELGKFSLLLEPLAGMVRVNMARSEFNQAISTVEEILTLFAEHTLGGTKEPILVFLTCYQTLLANQDNRARDILRTAFKFIEQTAANITEEKLVKTFKENISAHRYIILEHKKPAT